MGMKLADLRATVALIHGDVDVCMSFSGETEGGLVAHYTSVARLPKEEVNAWLIGEDDGAGVEVQGGHFKNILIANHSKDARFFPYPDPVPTEEK